MREDFTKGHKRLVNKLVVCLPTNRLFLEDYLYEGVAEFYRNPDNELKVYLAGLRRISQADSPTVGGLLKIGPSVDLFGEIDRWDVHAACLLVSKMGGDYYDVYKFWKLPPDSELTSEVRRLFKNFDKLSYKMNHKE